ncbi:MAG: M1 family metallopeptidase [Acidimicrobiales bacterium]
MTSSSVDPYRLPSDVVPVRYAVRLVPNLDDESFTGTVRITATALNDVAEIVLNSDGLTITTASVNGATTDVTIDDETERLILARSVPAGDVVIDLSFSGVFNDQLVGFYISRFDDADGNPQKLATTQFEATHARKAFPCWDEPAWKAVFDIEIVAPAGTNAIANTAEIGRISLDDGAQLISFAPTIKMSTYLVAFVVGPLEMTAPVDVDGVALRIVSVPGKSALTSFALECGEFALRYFTDYFGIAYPGDKCDLVAIPDFAFGAMENLGCITFREVLLLIDETSATQPELQRAADVINHELAHMWFGDLVTMKWWNGLWLNEAFATFMEMRCTDAFRPEWHRWVDFSLSRTAAFKTDALSTTRPIEFDVVSPEDAEGMFDILTYEKGAAVVRMLEQHLGEDRFRAGIRRYIREHAYANAETTDLWDAIEAETGEPVRRIMDSWIFQGGFPWFPSPSTARPSRSVRPATPWSVRPNRRRSCGQFLFAFATSSLVANRNSSGSARHRIGHRRTRSHPRVACRQCRGGQLPPSEIRPGPARSPVAHCPRRAPARRAIRPHRRCLGRRSLQRHDGAVYGAHRAGHRRN